MTSQLPEASDAQFGAIKPRQWWLFFELSRPKTVHELVRASGLVEQSVRSHLSALRSNGLIVATTSWGQPVERPDPHDIPRYRQAVSLTPEQVETAKKKIASARLSPPASPQASTSAQRDATQDPWQRAGLDQPANSGIDPLPPLIRDEDTPQSPARESAHPRPDRSEAVFKVLATIALLIAAVLAGVTASTATNVFGGIFLFLIIFVVTAFLLVAGATYLSELAKPPEVRAKEKSDLARAAAERQAQQPRPPAPGRVPLRQWRGLAYMTRAASVEAFCERCQRSWHIEGKVANTVADAQGLANRLIRGGTKMEQFGATFTIGASGRRIAAGNESARQQADLAWALSLAACPTCRQPDRVQLRKP